MANRSLPQFYGQNGLGRFLGLSGSRIGQINPPPDAFADGRPVWSEETAARLKLEREARRAQRRGALVEGAATA